MRNKTSERNALAELAEELKTGLSEKFGIPDDCDPFQSAVIKSVRIIEELGKPDRIDGRIACEIMMKCRAIAEESENG